MIYMDNSATSFPKPQRVVKAVKDVMGECMGNPGRSSHRWARESAEAVHSAREAVAGFVNALPENVVFTYNATYALNMVLRGLIKEADRVATDTLGHNSVLRPLYLLRRKKGIRLDFLKHSTQDKSDLCDNLKKMLESPEKPDVLVLTHTSNVTGEVIPLERIGTMCKKWGVLFILDASQGLGAHRIDMAKNNVDVICSSGHKGLFGIMGSGFAVFSENIKRKIEPSFTGGAGVMSMDEEMPPYLPERLEAGTLGVPSIISVRAGIDYINAVTSDYILETSQARVKRLYEGMSEIHGLKLYSDPTASSIILFNFDSVSCDKVAVLLDEEKIACRSGFHCAPLVHKALGTVDGAVRLSVSHFTRREECDKVLETLERLSRSLV